ncbi:FecR family protein [Flavobacterium sp. YO12]|uniref:FecR family protein n=1 Tax=Flavobacterium sp. YO12 TaxID=1920029 RepID=UPI00100B7D9D|nr:FecR family protein [Flavobacterium sp. YO12]RXM48396.1 hypothetical protein BOW55_06325 [Flavobacterium sp. YO12]
MMENLNSNIVSLIASYSLKELNQEEFDVLQNWVRESPENQKLFIEYLKVYKKSRQISFYQTLDKNKAWKKVKLELDNHKETQYHNERFSLFNLSTNFYKYAACAVVAIGGGIFFYLSSPKTLQGNEHSIVTSKEVVIPPGSNKATLVLGNGSTVVLGKGSSYIAKSFTVNNSTLTYKDQGKSKVEFNFLTIPRGGQFSLVLSDGTKVWLNSQSQLKFPNYFINGKARSVELVYGEAYFEVSPSTQHNGSHFMVKTKGQQVEVLGTHFNIKAYNDEPFLYATLVEGSIALRNKESREILRPDQQSIVKLNDNSIETKAVNAQKVVSWKEGVFNFENLSLEEIMKVLGRWYDVEVVFSDSSIKNMKFNGVLRKSQNINDILFTIKTLNNIEYEIEQRKITLTKRK